MTIGVGVWDEGWADGATDHGQGVLKGRGQVGALVSRRLEESCDEGTRQGMLWTCSHVDPPVAKESETWLGSGALGTCVSVNAHRPRREARERRVSGMRDVFAILLVALHQSPGSRSAPWDRPREIRTLWVPECSSNPTGVAHDGPGVWNPGGVRGTCGARSVGCGFGSPGCATRPRALMCHPFRVENHPAASIQARFSTRS